MSYTAKGANELLVAGIQDQMFKIDVERGQITEYVGILIAPSRIKALTRYSYTPKIVIV